jgi:hypothetical protein
VRVLLEILNTRYYNVFKNGIALSAHVFLKKKKIQLFFHCTLTEIVLKQPFSDFILKSTIFHLNINGTIYGSTSSSTVVTTNQFNSQEKELPLTGFTINHLDK